MTEIQGDEAVTGVKLRDLVTAEESVFSTDGIFIFVGHKPNVELFQNQMAFDERGYIQVDNLMRTSVPGVYAAGEAADPNYRQVVTSAGMGAAAAMQAVKYIESNS